MSIKLLLLKIWKPAVLLGSTFYIAYGYKQWQKAQLAMKINVRMSDTELINIFQAIDINKSGTIEKSELRRALSIAGLKYSQAALDAMFYAADESHSHRISLEDWLKICRHVHHQNHLSNKPGYLDFTKNPPKIQVEMKEPTHEDLLHRPEETKSH